jgi:hypothetical protein
VSNNQHSPYRKLILAIRLPGLNKFLASMYFLICRFIMIVKGYGDAKKSCNKSKEEIEDANHLNALF